MNGILLVDKPAGWTSMDVCAKLRGIFRERRIGHSGTLDPMATGLLVVFLGRATRAVPFAEGDEKTYEAALRLGVVTDTQDITGRVLSQSEARVTEEQLDAVLSRFRGVQMQLPPMYSAIKVRGQKLYDLARKGREVERQPREITVHALERRGFADNGDILLTVRCSKGTYVRTLCHDLGAALGCGGAMSALRRTRAGRFTLSGAHTLEQIQSAADRGEAASLLLPVDALFAGHPALTLTGPQEKTVRNGGAFSLPDVPTGRYRLFSRDGGFLALGQVRDGAMHTVKSFFEV